jgi:hypothetical protein
MRRGGTDQQQCHRVIKGIVQAVLDKAKLISFVSVILYAALLALAQDGEGVMRISATRGGTASETGLGCKGTRTDGRSSSFLKYGGCSSVRV